VGGGVLTEAVVARLRAAGCVFAAEEAALLLDAAASGDALEALLARREAGEPLEHVLGWAEFCGLRIAVEPGVFVPRHRTELLVRTAAAEARAVRGRPVVLDLCCGSGAVGAAVAALLPVVELHAADVDPAAVRCARRNLAPVGGAVHCGDLFEPLPRSLRGRVDVLAANVPYVPSDDVALMPPEARDHEPRRALDGGPDGLDVLRRVAAGARAWLAPGGVLVSETSERQSSAAAAAAAAAGLAPELRRADEATTLVARLPG
jgi:release factor glutamine methyltransferase